MFNLNLLYTKCYLIKSYLYMIIDDSMVDVSEQIENRSDNSELSQNVDKLDENVSG